MNSASGKPRKELPVIQPGQPVNRPPAEFQELLEWIGAGVEQMERIQDEQTREQVFALLEGIDALHRHALGRFVEQVRQLGGQGLMDRVSQDAVIQTLLDLYDLSGADERTQVESALQNVHPYIASHGGQLEVLGVENGRVRVRLSGACHGCPGSSVTIKRVVEQTLSEHVPSFQELIVEEPSPQATKPERRPRWVSVGWLDEFAPARLNAVQVEGISLLVIRIGDDVYAYRNGCPPGSALALTPGRLDGTVLVCPWHGCRYDVRTGARADDEAPPAGAPGTPLQSFPVAVEDWQVKVAIEIEEVAPE